MGIHRFYKCFRRVHYYFQVFTVGIFQTVVLWLLVVLSVEFTTPDLYPPKTGSLLLTVILKWAIVGGPNPVPLDYCNLILCVLKMRVSYFIHFCDIWFLLLTFHIFCLWQFLSINRPLLTC